MLFKIKFMCGLPRHLSNRNIEVFSQKCQTICTSRALKFNAL